MVYDKELHELWWEYLKRSENFRALCNLLVSQPDPDNIFLINTVYLPSIIPEICSSSPDKMFSHFLLWMNYKKFGDVFRTNFDDWWKSKQSNKSDNIVEDLEETIEREACFFIGYCAGIGQTHINDDTIIDLLKRYIEFNGQQQKFIKVRISANDREIRDAVSNLISRHKKKHTHSLDLLESYLTTYKLFKDGHDEKVIKKKILGSQALSHLTDKQAHDKIQLYRHKAEAIIFNVEKGDFPGKF